MFRDAVARLIDVEAGLLGTMRHLTVRPGRVMTDVLAGRRQPYVPPVRYYLGVWIGSTVLLQQEEGFRSLVADFAEAFPGGGGAPPDALLTLFQWLFALEVPFLAVALGIVFRRWERTLGERLAVATYAVGHRVVLALPLLLASLVTPPEAMNVAGAVALLPLFGWETWAVASAHGREHGRGAVWRAAAAALGAHILLFATLFTLVSVAYAAGR